MKKEKFTVMNRSFSKARKVRAGFTLIELLVVVLILGILLAVALPLYLSSVRNAGTRTVQANLKTIATAAQAYRVKNAVYPTAIGNLVGAGEDLQATPTGPGTTAYTLVGTTNTECVITAKEGTSDSFLTSAVGETVVYTLSTGQYTPPLQ